MSPLVADALVPPSGGQDSSHAGLRDDSLTSFDDPAITVTIVGSGSWSLTDDTTPADGCSDVVSGGSCDVADDDSVQLFATANGSPSTISWAGDSCNTTGDECDFQIGSSDDYETVAFTDTITTATSGTGTVAVADSPNSSYGCGASSGAPCKVVDGDQITLTAAAGAGYRFTKWSGGSCNGNQSTQCPTFQASGDEGDTANFAQTVVITTQTSGTGTGTATITDANAAAGCSGVTTCVADVGDPITITPAAGSSSRFTGWSGGTCSGTTNPCTFYAGSNGETDTANFAHTVTITTATSGAGSGSAKISDAAAGCSGVTSCLANENDSITITAAAGSGSSFTGFTSGSCSGTTNPCTFEAGSNGETDTANFAQTVTINTSTSGSGSGSATISDSAAGCSGVTTCVADVGDSVTITATAGLNSGFTGFNSGTCEGKPSPCTFSASSGETDTANFAHTVTISTATSGAGAGSATISDPAAGCSGGPTCLAYEGDSVTITAAAGSSSRFTGFTSGSCNGKANPCTFSAGYSSETDTANFAQTVTITTATSGAGSGTAMISDAAAGCSGVTTCVADVGDQVTITAAAGSSSRFTGFTSGSCSGKGNPCEFYAGSTDETDTANFAQTVTISTATTGTGSGSATITDTDSLAGCIGATSCVADVGDSITISATNGSGSRFTAFTTGTCAGKSNPCNFSASSSETDTASFAATVTISTTTSGAGSGTATLTDAAAGCTNVTSCLADEGDSVTITAAAGSNSRFTGFTSGSCNGKASPCTFSAGSSSETDTANFAQTVTIATATTGAGSGTATITDSDALAGCTGTTSCVADVGDHITITATNGANSRFTAWTTGSCASQSNPCSFYAGSNETDTASFAQTFTISTATGGAGTGTATLTDSAAGCTNVTTCVADSGDSIAITATAGSNSRFTGWTGGTCSGTTTPCTFAAAGNETDTANFAKTVTISTATAGAGSGTATISDSDALAGCANVTSCVADVSDSITITATAGSNSRFTGWSGGTCTGSTSPCAFSASTGETDTATFITTYQVTATASPVAGGSIAITDTLGRCSGTSTCTADAGDTVTLTATPSSSGYNFAGWSGGTCPTATTNNPSPVCKITNIAAADSETANFDVAYNIDAGVASGSGSVTAADTTNPADCTSDVCTPSAGDVMQFTANPATGWSFNRWTGVAPYGCDGLDATCTFAASDSESDEANFMIDTEEIDAVVATGEGTEGTVSVSDSNAASTCSPAPSATRVGCTADYGDHVVLTATPAADYHLIGWTGGTCAPATSDSCTVTADAPETDTASFGPNSFTITATTSPSSEGRLTLYDNNPNANCPGTTQSSSVSCTVSYQDDIVIVAYPVIYNHFVSWAPGGSCASFTGDRTCAFEATQAETDTGDFAPGTEVTVTAASSAGGSAMVTDPKASFCSASGSYCDVGVDDKVTLTAFPDTGYSLLGWSGGSCTGVTNPCVIDPGADIALNADETDNAGFALAVPGDGSPAVPGNGSPVYVSPNGNDGNPGTQAQPVATPQRGLAIIEGSGGTYNQLRIAQGSYGGGLSLTSKDDGIGIYGG
ncbi:MAG: hypothetical protein ABR947_07790, partial [Solirubrobacteraceae bacterium]